MTYQQHQQLRQLAGFTFMESLASLLDGQVLQQLQAITLHR